MVGAEVKRLARSSPFFADTGTDGENHEVYDEN